MASVLELAGVNSVAFNRIFVCKTLSTSQLIQAAVWLWVHNVVLQFNHLVVGSANQRCRVVAVAEVVARLASFLLNEFLTVYALRVHGNECCHAVAAVDVEGLSDRAEAVSGVNVTAVFAVVFQAPAELFGV